MVAPYRKISSMQPISETLLMDDSLPQEDMIRVSKTDTWPPIAIQLLRSVYLIKNLGGKVKKKTFTLFGGHLSRIP